MGSISPVSIEATFSTLQSTTTTNSDKSSSTEVTKSIAEFSANSDAVILDASLGTKTAASNTNSSSGDGFQALYQSLSLTGKQIVDKINEQLKVSLPDGVQSLKPEDVTPEATADRIVSGVTALFDQYAKQNPDLSGDKLVDAFVSEVQKGVTQGYGDAVKFLQSSGAFDVNGVQDGVAQTRSLIDDKLAAFADQKKKDLSSAAQSDDTPKTDTAAATPAPTTIDAVA